MLTLQGLLNILAAVVLLLAVYLFVGFGIDWWNWFHSPKAGTALDYEKLISALMMVVMAGLCIGGGLLNERLCRRGWKR